MEAAEVQPDVAEDAAEWLRQLRSKRRSGASLAAAKIAMAELQGGNFFASFPSRVENQEGEEAEPPAADEAEVEQEQEAAPQVAGSVPVSVLVRCRPHLGPQKDQRINFTVNPDAGNKVSLVVDPRSGPTAAESAGSSSSQSRPRGVEVRTFRCNAVCSESATQEEVFQHALPVVDMVMEGFNGTIFCYGITGSGKTYTMSGPQQETKKGKRKPQQSLELGENQGIAQRAAKRIFEFIRDRSEKGEVFTVQATFLEIYSSDGVREQLVDLLSDAGAEEQKLEIRQDPLCAQAFLCDGLRAVTISSPTELCEVLEDGRRRCTYMETSRNCLSSRSHCLFTLTVECLVEPQNPNSQVRRGKLVLVDLAGSESLKKVVAASSQDEELRRRQAIGINRVLSHLGAVVNNLNAGNQNRAGYRNSALTMLLRDCLGGRARALLVANIGPELDFASETYMTLTFAQKMMQVRNVEKAVVIEGSQSVLVQMRKRHLECITRLQEKMDSESGQQTEEWAQLQGEVANLSKRLLTKTSAAEALEDLSREQQRQMERMREELTTDMARQLATIQEQSLRSMEGLKEVIESKAREGKQLSEKQTSYVMEAQLKSLQEQLGAAAKAREEVESETTRLRVQLAAASERAETLQELQNDSLKQRSEFESERRELRRQADDQRTKIIETEGEMQRYRAQASVHGNEVQRLRDLMSAETLANEAERREWAESEAKLKAQLKVTQDELEELKAQTQKRAAEANALREEQLGGLRRRAASLEDQIPREESELQELKRKKDSAQRELHLSKAHEEELRREVEEEFMSHDDKILAYEDRFKMLMQMLSEVQSNIMTASRTASKKSSPSK